uniref:Uncharacterized protein n=1 Tax=Oryza nivara TaxID=4536 RepID=A0A0E0G2K6_ORYNI
MEVEHLSPSRWRGSAASAAVPDVARARALLPHGGRGQKLGHRLRYRVITIQLRFDDQDAMLDDTLTGKGGQGIRAVAGTTTEESDTDAGDNAARSGEGDELPEIGNLPEISN